MMDGESSSDELNQPLLESSAQNKSLSTARQNGVLLVVLSLLCCSLNVDTLIYPFFPWVSEQKGITSAQTGLVFSAYDLARFISSPIVGTAMSKWNSKTICILGSIITAAACITFGTFDRVHNKDIFLILCITARLFGGVGSAMLVVSATSILMKATTYQTTTIVSIIEIIDGATNVIGPLYGAALYALTGYSPMFWIIGGLMLIVLPAFVLAVPHIENSGNSNKHFFDLLAIPGCSLMLLHCVIVRLLSSSRATGVSEWIITTFHKDLSFVAMIFGAAGTMHALTCFLFSKTPIKKHTYIAMIIGLSGAAVCCLFQGPSEIFDFLFHQHQYVWLAVSCVMGYNVFVPFLFIPPFQAALDLAHVNGYEQDNVYTYGVVAAMINCGYGLGATVGPTIGGAITDSLGFTWTLTIAAFLAITMAMMLSAYLTYMRLTNQLLAPAKHADKETNVSQTGTPGRESAEEMVAEACNKTMTSCLSEHGGVTSTHQQQPEIQE